MTKELEQENARLREQIHNDAHEYAAARAALNVLQATRLSLADGSKGWYWDYEKHTAKDLCNVDGPIIMSPESFFFMARTVKKLDEAQHNALAYLGLIDIARVDPTIATVITGAIEILESAADEPTPEEIDDAWHPKEEPS